MALNIDKLKKTENPVQSTSVSQTSDPGAGNVSRTPIDFTSSNPENKQQADILNYIKSEEYANLTPEEKIKQLKEKFYPTLSDEQIQQNLTVITQAAAQSDGNNASVAKVSNAAPNDEEVDLLTPEAEAKQSNIEKLIQNAGLTGNIDEIISQLLSEEKNGTLSNEGKVILEEYRSVEKENSSSQQGKTDTDSKNLIPLKTLLSDDFRDKSNKEKLSILADSYLSKTNSEYNNLSKNEKQKLIEAQIKELKSIICHSERKHLSDAEEKKFFADSMILLSAANAGGKSLDEIKNMKPAELQDFIQTAEKQQIQYIVKMVPPEKLEGKDSSEKIKTYADCLLSLTDDKYKTLEGAEKQKYLEDKINDFIEKSLGIESWSNLKPEEKNRLFKKTTTDLCAVAKDGISLDGYLKMSELDQTKYLLKALNAENNTKDSSLVKELETKIDLIQSMQNEGIKDPTDKDIYNRLLKLEKSGKLTNEQKLLLQDCKVEKDLGILDGKGSASAYSNKLNATEIFKGDVKKYFESSLSKLNKNNIAKYKKKINSFVKGAITDQDINQIEALKQILKSKGLSNSEIKELIPDMVFNKLQAKGLSRGNGKLVAAGITMAEKSGNKKVIATSAVAMRYAPKYINNEDELAIVGVEAAKYDTQRTAYAEGLNNREYITKEKAARVANNVLCSADVSDANKASFTKEFVTSAAKNGSDEQLYFGRELSKIDSPAVTEGLAAASKYVTDPAARKQYDSYVDNAMKNYPPEQQEVIRQARETGEISSNTLEQTGTKASTETSSSARNQATGETQKPSAGNTLSGKVSTQSQGSQGTQEVQNTVENSGRTGISTTPKVSNSDNTVTISGVSASGTEKAANTTSTSSDYSYRAEIASMNDAEAEKLTQEAEAVLTKIENFLEAQSKSIKQWEERQDSDTSAEEAATSLSEDDVIEAAVNGDSGSLADVNLSGNEKETLRKTITAMFENNSTSAAYQKLVTKFGEGAKTKFLQAFAQNADSASIRMFADDFKNDSQVISLLYQYSQDSSLIAYLPKDEIFNLLMKGKISDLSKISPDILSDFIQEKMKTETNPQNLAGYVTMLPLEYQGAVMSQYPDLAAEVRGSKEWEDRYNTQDKTKVSENPKSTEETTAPKSQTAFVPDENINLFGTDDFQPFEVVGPSMASNRVPHNKRGSGDKDYDKLKRNGHVWLS